MFSNELKKDQTHSAVLVLHELLSDSLVLTKRSDYLRTHPGEICFPGGKWDVEDKNLYETALRELHEELGIVANRVTVVKKLEYETTLLETIIHPWLVNIESIAPFQLNSQEISSIILIPMNLAQDPKNYRKLIINRDSQKFESCAFIPHDELIWGATARIMKQLCHKKG